MRNKTIKYLTLHFLQITGQIIIDDPVLTSVKSFSVCNADATATITVSIDGYLKY